MKRIRNTCVSNISNVGSPSLEEVTDFVNRIGIFIIRFDSANCSASWLSKASGPSSSGFASSSKSLSQMIASALKKRFKTVVSISLCTADMRIPLANVEALQAGQSLQELQTLRETKQWELTQRLLVFGIASVRSLMEIHLHGSKGDWRNH